MIRCHIGFRLRSQQRGAPPPPTPPALKRAFSYCWRLWTLPDCAELLAGAGFASSHVWARRMREDGEPRSDSDADEADDDASGGRGGDAGSSDEGGSDGSDEDGSGSEGSASSRGGRARRGGREGKSSDEYVEITAATPPATLHRLARGWQAYLVAVVR